MGQKVVAMDVRLAVAFAALPDERVDVTAVCARLGISRQTYYVYRRRFAAEGVMGLLPRSRRPGRSPRQVSGEVEDLIVGLRKRLGEAGLDSGARSIFYRLRRAGVAPPAVSTIHRVLARRGLVSPQPQKRPRSAWRRFEFAQPNGCWQLDATEWALADGTVVHILRVLDDHSRKMLGFRVAQSENAVDAWACLADAVGRHGRPAVVLSDNSRAFTGREVTRALRALGAVAISSRHRHPQTCGKKEREHATLKRWLRAQPPAGTVTQLTTQLRAYDLIYNDQRPHQALDGATPTERYAASAKAIPARSAHRGPPRVSEGAVTARGVLALDGWEIQLGREWCHAPVTAFRDGMQVAIFYRDRLARSLTLDPNRKYQPLGRPGSGPRRSRVHPPPPLPTLRASSLPAEPAEREERSTCSARSAARTNDVDGDEPRRTIDRRGSPRRTGPQQ